MLAVVIHASFAGMKLCTKLALPCVHHRTADGILSASLTMIIARMQPCKSCYVWLSILTCFRADVAVHDLLAYGRDSEARGFICRWPVSRCSMSALFRALLIFCSPLHMGWSGIRIVSHFKSLPPQHPQHIVCQLTWPISHLILALTVLQAFETCIWPPSTSRPSHSYFPRRCSDQRDMACIGCKKARVFAGGSQLRLEQCLVCSAGNLQVLKYMMVSS